MGCRSYHPGRTGGEGSSVAWPSQSLLPGCRPRFQNADTRPHYMAGMDRFRVSCWKELRAVWVDVFCVLKGQARGLVGGAKGQRLVTECRQQPPPKGSLLLPEVSRFHPELLVPGDYL